ncbi:uncharacterized protein EI97DRAFT_436864 [Westerdykella ornata]|uniref:HAUS augmin-like complex subunit 3 N-terminal domain-containing protein n=1 Tax=Westerdykella ornata TaxID=318751 RepID=A0A6A6J7W4_WESOR|nr:uncharacterized protein EI97DRAFT_436864 [Westerdykella ornata]KAF2272485.1 hypothetical protein EI97DRAFT_436864 [Westerdykella ornata]
MAEEAAAHHLLNVLEERELNVDLDKVLAAFEDEDMRREAAEWVNEYLNEGTLLTKEEFELCEVLKKKGVLQHYNGKDGPARPFLDHELYSAIDALETSTAAIEQQCKVLEAQRDALMALRALDKPSMAAEHLRNDRRRKEHQEKSRLDMAVEDATTAINDQVADTQRDIDNEKSALKSWIKERLASDDKILANLPGIVSKILTEPVVSEDEKSVEQWCKAIVSFRTAEIKARVDTVYLRSLTNDSPDRLPNAPEEELRQRKEELQAELETLHSEISSVAEMVVEHELRKPMTDMKERKEREREQARSAWLNYVLSTLDFMGKRLDVIAARSEEISDFYRALNHIHAAAKQRQEEITTQPKSSSPVLKRTVSHSKSAFPPITLKPTSTLNIHPALQDALRHAGISYTQENIAALKEALLTTQLEREKKLSDHYDSASSSTHEQLAERLGKADAEARVILDSLYAHTPFATVRLRDPEVERKIREKERKVEEAEMGLLSAETGELGLGDERVRAFVERFGR